jgi:hypothetical protein
MTNAQAVCYLVAIILLVIAAFGITSRVSLVTLAAAVAILGYALPGIAHLVA